MAALEMGLRLDQGFMKKEATSDDIVVLLQIFWKCAALIRCKPITRCSFHNMLLLGAIGGFRPGVLKNIKYRDVCLALVRIPKEEGRRLVATFTLHQNKRKASSVQTNQKHMQVFRITLWLLPTFLMKRDCVVLTRCE